MADGFSFSILTKPTTDAFSTINRKVDRSSMWAVREAGRLVKTTAKAKAPVYKGGVKVSAVKRARRAGLTLSGEQLRKGQTVEGNQVVSGLLRDSIASSKRLKQQGDTYSVVVGPRGPRVHLYASKIEARTHFMSAAYATVVAAARDIHERAWAKAMNI